MEKLVFYIEKEKFLRTMIEAALKLKNHNVYTIDTIVDNYYLIDDLKPQVIIFDIDTMGAELHNFIKYVKEATLVATGTKNQRELVQGYVHDFIEKPILASKLANRLVSYFPE